jgi:tripartite-type tricarboxylate transporter receptor subunit TctC
LEIPYTPADGYTIVLAGNGNAISQTLFKALPYNNLNDFMQVSTLASFDLVLLVSPDSKFTSLADVIAFAKNNPGKLNLGTIGVGSTQHLSAELFKSLAGINALIVPYKSTPDLIVALRSNTVDIAFEFVPPTLPQIESNAVKPLVIASNKRLSGLPGTPTTVESGLPNYLVTSWNAISVWESTPRPIIDRLYKEVAAAVSSPEVSQKLQSMGARPGASTPEETRELMRSEIAKWKAVIEAANIPRQ